MYLSSCEYASKALRSKFFKDRLKLVLAPKAYINGLIANSSYLAEEDIKRIKIPLIQIIGFEAQLTISSVKDKGIFTAEVVFKLSFPTTKKEIEQGAISNIIKALSLTQVTISS
ncbi:hypothetical protein CU097_006986 [Rhizopus azygosporus]|uniref:Uncharacterized protein n=1 Tax=Rhizopus azygosporus TaxID=86630 RepID=A0A367IZY2_RHIAZ|nr:hypothetical protein CU097_006986 [Rhizopus azygosporus]